jgi:carbonic anhydrase
MRTVLLSFLLDISFVSGGCGGETPPAESPPPVTATPDASASVGALDSTHALSPAVNDAGTETAKPPAHVAWSYTGEGAPDKWGDLAPSFALCKDGKAQTPIDISSKLPKSPTLEGLVFQYPTIPLAIFNNGHTVEVPNPGPAAVAEGSKKWNLLQFHFHAPSEHTLDGKQYDAEVHFVHANDKGELAVVGVFVKKGKENAALKAVFVNAPSEIGTDPKPVAGATVDLKAVLPAKPSYFTYDGSLTVPPCTEGVTWFLLKAPIEASVEQIAEFHEVTHGDTDRPVQPLNGRTVLRY